MSYKFIEEVPPEARPERPKKRYYKITMAEQILNEFIASKADFVKVDFTKVKKAKNAPKGTPGYTEAGFCSRAIGRVISRKELKNIEVWSDDKNIYLEKTA